ncbi:basic salivary proline-rich protein 3-like [Corapipo altera]|uniref:basic salivary proline-rich protein 3-like n=1 Tax=Corapipo altera TaxID=415028 RepID=UPI000FD67C0A|nr:basic salivary proline-rich protein 3-like [Corapipo altera]
MKIVKGLEEKLYEEQLRSPGLSSREETEGRPYYNPQLPHEGSGGAGVNFFSLGNSDKTQGNSMKSCRRREAGGGDNIRNSISPRTAGTTAKDPRPGSPGGRRGEGGRSLRARPHGCARGVRPCRAGGAQASAPGNAPPPPQRRRGGRAQPEGPCFPPRPFWKVFSPVDRLLNAPAWRRSPAAAFSRPSPKQRLRCPSTAPVPLRRQAGGQPGHASGLGQARLPACPSLRHHVTPTKHVCAPVCGGGDFLIRRRSHRRRDGKGHPPPPLPPPPSAPQRPLDRLRCPLAPPGSVCSSAPPPAPASGRAQNFSRCQPPPSPLPT